MAATLELKRWLAQGTSDAFYNNFIQFGTVDTANVSSGSHPIGRPSGGVNYSIELYLFLNVVNAPDNNINNIRFWGNPAIPAQGIIMYVGTSVSTSAPVNSLSANATINTTAYPSVDDNLLWSDKNMSSVNDTSHYLVMQLGVYSSALIGDEQGDNMVFHYSYDES